MLFEQKTVRLQDITSVIGDGLHGTPVYDDKGEYFFINGNNLRNGKIETNPSTRRVSENEHHNYKKQLSDRTILVSINGTLGNVALYRGEKVVLGKSACYLNVNQDVDTNFVRYVLESPLFQNYVHNLATGSTIKNVSLKLMRDFTFSLPSILAQHKIANVLGTLDNKINLLQETNRTLEAIAQAIFKSWFIDYDPVHAKQQGKECEGIDAETAALFPDGFESSELGEIPKGWGVSSVGSEFKLTMGQSPPGDSYNTDANGMPFYQGRTDFGYRFPTIRVYCSAPTRIAKQGDILVSVRAPVGDVNVAIEECCLGRGVAGIRHPRDCQSYALYTITSLDSHFKKFDGEGTVFGSINKKDFESIPLVVPPDNVIVKFEAIASFLDRKIINNEFELRTLSKLRDTLLPRLISGRLRIEDAQSMVEGVQ